MRVAVVVSVDENSRYMVKVSLGKVSTAACEGHCNYLSKSERTDH